MEDVLSTQFDRVEKALGTLVDSIAAYNPSPQAALDLVAADDDLSQGLDQLARHQTNHARIQALRSEAEALEEQLRASVSALASLRHELFETPATTFPTDTRPIHFDELLQYAKNISQHTVPPTYREHAPQTATDKDKDKDKEDGGSSAAPTDGVNTPSHPPALPDAEEPKDTQNPHGALGDITAEEEEWLTKLKDSKIAWYPWPSNDKIQAGNLYKLMYWQAMGKDVDHFDVYAHEEAERIKNLNGDQPHPSPLPQPVHEPQPPQEAAPRPAPKPARPQQTFDAFDDLDDE